MKKTIIYLHGFNSNSLSLKAVQLKTFINQNETEWQYWIPDLPLEPDKAIKCCESYINEKQQDTQISIIGSSLGAFYAIYLANKYKLKCIVINPAIHPERYLGVYEKELYEMVEKMSQSWIDSYVNFIKTLKVSSISQPEHFMLLAQKGDELIDYTIAQSYFKDAKSVIEDNGNHNFEGFEQKLPLIFEFLG